MRITVKQLRRIIRETIEETQESEDVRNWRQNQERYRAKMQAWRDEGERTRLQRETDFSYEEVDYEAILNDETKTKQWRANFLGKEVDKIEEALWKLSRAHSASRRGEPIYGRDEPISDAEYRKEKNRLQGLHKRAEAAFFSEKIGGNPFVNAWAGSR